MSPNGTLNYRGEKRRGIQNFLGERKRDLLSYLEERNLERKDTMLRLFGSPRRITVKINKMRTRGDGISFENRTVNAGMDLMHCLLSHKN